jgi:ABC-type microcin C transport system permease subunit YejB
MNTENLIYGKNNIFYRNKKIIEFLYSSSPVQYWTGLMAKITTYLIEIQ